MKIKIGDILKTSDDKLVTNKDEGTSNKSRLLGVTSVDKNDDLTGIKIYTHGSNVSDGDIEVIANPKLSKKSLYGKHIITHEYILDEKNEKVPVRLNMKNGNLSKTEHKVEQSNLDEAVSVLSNREKRKYNRHK